MWSGFLAVDPKFANLSSAPVYIYICPIERLLERFPYPPCHPLPIRTAAAEPGRAGRGMFEAIREAVGEHMAMV